jgi:hypothetical protein
MWLRIRGFDQYAHGPGFHNQYCEKRRERRAAVLRKALGVGYFCENQRASLPRVSSLGKC